METNLRIAEYKFIDWRGGSETIRQNGPFKDFFELAEYEGNKERYLYVDILSRLVAKHGTIISTVRDYYLKKENVHICDVSSHIAQD